MHLANCRNLMSPTDSSDEAKKEATIVKCSAWEESAMRNKARMGEEAGVGKEAGMRGEAHVRSAAKPLRGRGAFEQNDHEADNAEHSRHRHQHQKGL